MYVGGGELTENIDDVGGAGTAEFASKAIDIFYMSRKSNFSSRLDEISISVKVGVVASTFFNREIPE